MKLSKLLKQKDNNDEKKYWDAQWKSIKEHASDPNSYENNWDYYD